MEFLEKIKLDRWFGVVFYLGVLLMAGSVFGNIDFINKKHVFGLGLGAVFIGISYFIAEKYLHQYFANGIASTKVIKHNTTSIVVLLIGIFLTAIFGYKIIIGLLSDG